MRYGSPYKGSKNAIAEWIVNNLPPNEYFVDLFFGGGAVTHCAMLKGKYKRFIINDIDSRLPKLFIECAYGKHTVENHREWIDRETFFKRRDEIYIALIWSFGNNGIDYLYGKDIEEMKHAYHKAVYDNNMDDIKKYGYTLERSYKADIYERYLDYQQQIKKQAPKAQLECLTRQIEVERLQSLQSLQSFGADYQSVPIPDGALIYCDIPYYASNCGKYKGFDHDRFYKWAKDQDNIYISEYQMPEGFIEIARIDKTILSAANGNSQVATERIYTNEKTYSRLDASLKERYEMDMAEQICFW